MESHYFQDILILLAAAIVSVPVFKKLGLGSVLGYLFAGAVVGPSGLAFITQIEEIRHFAEFGVVFLLFVIGMELKPERLWSMRKQVFGLGGLQVLITGALLTGIVLLMGIETSPALVIGMGLALSSTAFVLQMLDERGEMSTHHGQASFSILLLQDVAVVPLLAMVSLLSAGNESLDGLEWAVLEAVLVIVAVILFNRYMLSPLLRQIALTRNAEVFTAAALLAVLGTAWLMEEVGLSLAMGAFLAGLMMSDSHYRHQVFADINPFRGILLGLFFMGVGMSVNFALFLEQAPLILALLAALLLIKWLVLYVLARFFLDHSKDALRTSLYLSQSGEFGFVLFALAASNQLLSNDLVQTLTVVIALSMVTTPLMPVIAEKIIARTKKPEEDHEVHAEFLDDEKKHVIIAGFGRVGRRIAQLLQAADMPYMAIDNDAEDVRKARKEGFHVYFGDASHMKVLKAAEAEKSAVIICTLDDKSAAIKLVKMVHNHFPQIPIHARGHSKTHCEELHAAGASVAISETLETSLQLGQEMLQIVGVDPEEINGMIDRYRKDYYSVN